MKKIVEIEDEAQTRNMFLECLEAEGFDAIGAENGLRRPAGTVTVARFGDLRHYDAGTRWLPCPLQLRKTLSQQSFPSFSSQL